MIDKKRERKDRYFKFDLDYKWITPETLYIPFEFRLLLCNYYTVRLCVLGKGFEVNVRWFDVVKETKKPEEKGTDVLKKSLKLYKQKSQQLKKVSQIPMDLLIESGKRDISGTLQTKISVRHSQQHAIPRNQ
jgi:hypothetical protein